MGLLEWTYEFYPCPADSARAREDPLKHCFRKWTGLLDKNLFKHGVYRHGNRLEDHYGYRMTIDWQTCALCHIWLKSEEKDNKRCAGCPLAEFRGGISCDRKARWESRSPFEHFKSGHSARLMLHPLKCMTMARQRQLAANRQKPRIDKSRKPVSFPASPR